MPMLLMCLFVFATGFVGVQCEEWSLCPGNVVEHVILQIEGPEGQQIKQQTVPRSRQ